MEWLKYLVINTCKTTQKDILGILVNNHKQGVNYYYRDNVQWYEMNYLDNKLHGVQLYWDSTKDLHSEQYYINGKLINVIYLSYTININNKISYSYNRYYPVY